MSEDEMTTMNTDWKAIELISLDDQLVIDNQEGHLFEKVDIGLWICSCGVYLKKVVHDLGFMRRYSEDGKTWSRINPPCIYVCGHD